jgi:hypothetical protein
LGAIDRATRDLFLRNIDDLGMVTDGTLDLYSLGFVSHTPLPRKYAIYHRLIFGVNLGVQLKYNLTSGKNFY